MGTRRQGLKATDAAGARVDHRELLETGRANTPCLQALELLGAAGSMEKSRAVFDYRASRWQVIDWRLGRRGMPRWAVELMRQKLAGRGAMFSAVSDSLERALGPGLGWNKNATRGLGEWRAKQNLRRDVQGS